MAAASGAGPQGERLQQRSMKIAAWTSVREPTPDTNRNTPIKYPRPLSDPPPTSKPGKDISTNESTIATA